MKPQFRILENKQGKFEVYYVENIGKSYFFNGKEVLKPYITWSGLDEVYQFTDITEAIEQLELEVIKNTARI